MNSGQQLFVDLAETTRLCGLNNVRPKALRNAILACPPARVPRSHTDLVSESLTRWPAFDYTADIQCRFNPEIPAAGFHVQIDFACGTGDIVPRRSFAEKHVPGVVDFLVVDAVHQTIGEGVSPEIAPEIPAASEHLAVPIDLRQHPQLGANRLQVVMAELLYEFLAGRDPQASSLPDGFLD